MTRWPETVERPCDLQASAEFPVRKDRDILGSDIQPLGHELLGQAKKGQAREFPTMRGPRLDPNNVQNNGRVGCFQRFWATTLHTFGSAGRLDWTNHWDTYLEVQE